MLWNKLSGDSCPIPWQHVNLHAKSLFSLWGGKIQKERAERGSHDYTLSVKYCMLGTHPQLTSGGFLAGGAHPADRIHWLLSLMGGCTMGNMDHSSHTSLIYEI